MAQLSEKELASIQELLADEDLLVKKFKMLAEHAENDAEGHSGKAFALVCATGWALGCIFINLRTTFFAICHM